MEGCLFTATSVYGLSCWLHVLFNTQHTCSDCKDTKEIAVQFFKPK